MLLTADDGLQTCHADATPIGVIHSAVSSIIGGGSVENQAPEVYSSENAIVDFSPAPAATSIADISPAHAATSTVDSTPAIREFSPNAASSLSPLPLIEIPYSAPLIAPQSSPSLISRSAIHDNTIFSTSLLRPVSLKATLELDAASVDTIASKDADDATTSKRTSVKIGGAEYRLVLPRDDRDEMGFDAFVGDASLRASTPPSSSSGFSFRPIDDAPASAGYHDAPTPSATAASSAAKTELDSAEWNLPVDGCELKKIETLMNSKTLRKAKRKNYFYKKYSSNIGAAASFNNKQREIFQPFKDTEEKRIFIVVPVESSSSSSSASVAKKNTKFVFKTSSFVKFAKKSAKIPRHPLQRKKSKGGDVPSTPKMFSKAAVQRNVLYMKSGDKLGYKKMRKMSSCPKNEHRCNGCPLKNKQSICHQELATKKVK